MRKMRIGITRFDTADDAAGGTRRPFAKAVRAGDFVFVSGQVPAVDGEIIVGGIVEQAEQVIANIIAALGAADCGLEHVVKVNVWLDDPRDFHQLQRRVRTPFPRSSTRSFHGPVRPDGRREG